MLVKLEELINGSNQILRAKAGRVSDLGRTVTHNITIDLVSPRLEPRKDVLYLEVSSTFKTWTVALGPQIIEVIVMVNLCWWNTKLGEEQEG